MTMLHKTNKASISIALALLVMAAVIGGILSIEPLPALAQRQSSYAIYLSPGPRQGIEWGGYHATVTSFSKEHAPGRSEKKVAKKAWNKIHGYGPFYFDKKQRGIDYWAHDLGNGYGYGVCFKSKELDRLTKDLHKQKFDNQKQLDKVNKGSKCRWHVSLYCKTPEEAIKKFEKDLKYKPWKLYEVRYPGTDWTEIG
jgi:hypothetical protein